MPTKTDKIEDIDFDINFEKLYWGFLAYLKTNNLINVPIKKTSQQAVRYIQIEELTKFIFNVFNVDEYNDCLHDILDIINGTGIFGITSEGMVAVPNKDITRPLKYLRSRAGL